VEHVVVVPDDVTRGLDRWHHVEAGLDVDLGSILQNSIWAEIFSIMFLS
jgi:hypothetical protein